MCEHLTIVAGVVSGGKPVLAAHCADCSELVEMECLSFNKPCGCLGYSFWQKSNPADRLDGHPANRTDCAFVRPGWWHLVGRIEDDADRARDHGQILGIGWAVKQMHNGDKVRRAGWNGKGMWLILVTAHEWTTRAGNKHVNDSNQMLPWVGMKTADNKFVPWLCSQTDLLATDWEIA